MLWQRLEAILIEREWDNPHNPSVPSGDSTLHNPSALWNDLTRSRLHLILKWLPKLSISSRYMDYTGQLPTACTSGVQYCQIVRWDHYIDIQPLTSLRAAQTTKACIASVKFYRKHEIIYGTLRMNNHSHARRISSHCSRAYLDKCLPQIVITLNLIHSFEYDDSISAYQSGCPQQNV